MTSSPTMMTSGTSTTIMMMRMMGFVMTRTLGTTIDQNSSPGDGDEGRRDHGWTVWRSV